MHTAGVWCLRAGAAPGALLQPLRVPPCSCRGRQCCARGCVPACRCRTHGSGSRCPGQEGHRQRFWSRDSREFPHPAPSQQSPRLHGPGQERQGTRGSGWDADLAGRAIPVPCLLSWFGEGKRGRTNGRKMGRKKRAKAALKEGEWEGEVEQEHCTNASEDGTGIIQLHLGQVWAFLSQTQVFYPAEGFEFHFTPLHNTVWEYANPSLISSHSGQSAQGSGACPVTLAGHLGNSLGEAPLQESSCPEDASVQP